MAQLMTVRLTRNDGQPWGFRLQGGKDFGSPLALQKVSLSLDIFLMFLICDQNQTSNLSNMSDVQM